MMGGMSENLALLGAYSDAMFRGDEQAVFEYWSPDFVSHVTRRVNPDMVGSDVRGEEVKWWAQVRNAFPDYVFTVDLLIEKDDAVRATTEHLDGVVRVGRGFYLETLLPQEDTMRFKKISFIVDPKNRFRMLCHVHAM